MFYPENFLRKGGRFYLCWVADSWPLHFATVNQRKLMSQDICVLCDELMEVVTSESGHLTNRFSLRLSCQLLRGLVRLYQRKVNVLLKDLCMMDANILKTIIKKYQEPVLKASRVATNHQQMQVISEMIVDVNETVPRMEELIQNGGNIVANVQDITLKEATIPELVVPPGDGFGEEHPEQALQMVTDRSIEVMLHGEQSTVQHSAVDTHLDVTSKSQDKTRQPEHHMEMISEHDITMFRKDITDIPDIPIPELPVPQITTITTDVQEQLPITEQQKSKRPGKRPSATDIQLEDLDEAEVPTKKKKKCKLIFDKQIKIDPDIMRARNADPLVWLRCKNVQDDIISIKLPCDVYFNRPCHVGRKIYMHRNSTLIKHFRRKLDAIGKKPLVQREPERIMAHTRIPYDISIVRTVEATDTAIVPEVRPVSILEQTELDIPQEIVANGKDTRKSPEEAATSSMGLDKHAVLSPLTRKRRSKVVSDDTLRAKRSQEYVTLEKQAAVIEAVPQEAEKKIDTTRQKPQAELEEIKKDIEKTALMMLEEAGLRNLQVEREIEETRDGKPETPRGSDDRTSVSLGDTGPTTESVKLMRQEWGAEGIMLKILNHIKYVNTPVNIDTLLANGPILQGYRKMIAARCFGSIIKLKQHGFLKIIKRENTSDIAEIKTGRLFFRFAANGHYCG